MNKKTFIVATLILNRYLTSTTIRNWTPERLQSEVKKATEERIKTIIPTSELESKWKDIVCTSLISFTKNPELEKMRNLNTFFHNNPNVFLDIYNICENVPTHSYNLLVFVITSICHTHFILIGENTKWTKEQAIDYLVSKYNDFLPQDISKGKLIAENLTDDIIIKIVTNSLADLKCLTDKSLMINYRQLSAFDIRTFTIEKLKTMVDKSISTCFNNVFGNWSINKKIETMEMA